jgi:uncharacterized membrane protein YkoI
MKLKSLLALALVVSFLFLEASARDDKGDAKITKNEAEHIALKRFPGAHVTAAKLDKAKGKLVWLVEIAKGNLPQVTKVEVDAMSGRIISGEKAER